MFVRVRVEKVGDLRRLDGAEFGCGFGCRGEGCVAVGPSADRKSGGERFAFGRVFCVKGSLCVRCAPFAVDQYLSYIHLSYIHCFVLSNDC